MISAPPLIDNPHARPYSIYGRVKKSCPAGWTFRIPPPDHVDSIADDIRRGDIPPHAREYIADLLKYFGGTPGNTLFIPHETVKKPSRGEHRRKSIRQLVTEFRAVIAEHNSQSGRKSWKRAADVVFPGGWDKYRRVKKDYIPIIKRGELIMILYKGMPVYIVGMTSREA